ncbi:YheT family hydrolase [Urechidicola croceus]|uniref:Alpha/beta hydrolase n=1 Tax=Urechidicola croceus TaxID=1850246 RepID=A0A1D8P4L9_9FLAO|nr:alpha/beta fold hydrolase [Urechidicola croceus]AOW19523.1 alpha/beta hydrolase [Urechidicola croceus]
MPVINSTYKASFPFNNVHFNTVFRTFFTHDKVQFSRERIELKDGDFLDLDFSEVNSKTIVIALHGLEGSSESKYILAITNILNQNNVDTVAVNFRGCSGEDNRLLSSYHSGKTEDLEAVIQYIDKFRSYKNIIILGYSLGGNVTLKFLGEKNTNINSKIKCAIAISVPCDLTGSSIELAKTRNKIYMNRFMITLKQKALGKLNKFPNSFLDKDTITKAKNFYDYDNLYTAPAHGFLNAEDYWIKNSSKPFLKDIKVPTLLINALDDTFLSKECYPIEIAKKHKYLFLETPKNGGHVGFNSKIIGKKGYWLENRIAQFLKEYV